MSESDRTCDKTTCGSAAMSSDLLYLYCGGNRQAVLELLVSAHSLVETNPHRTFRIGIGLDRESAQLLDLAAVQRTPGTEVQILDDQLPSQPQHERHTLHVVNRWRCLRQFAFERAIILDIDTVVTRPLDELFPNIHPDVEYFTTFTRFAGRDRRWRKHMAFYNSVGTPYLLSSPLYCAIGMHAIRSGWPHVDDVIAYCKAMDQFKRRHRKRRAFVEEYSINLVLLQNGAKVHFPLNAIRKARGFSGISSDQPYAWHFILGRARSNPLWQASLSAVRDTNFWEAASLIGPAG